MEVEPVLSGDHRQRGVEVATEFIGRAGAAGVVAGHGQTAADRSPLGFEPADVVALPAMQRHGDLRQGRESLLGVHPESLVTLTRELVGGFDLLGGGHAVSLGWSRGARGREPNRRSRSFCPPHEPGHDSALRTQP
jgi:hypothetical protein